MFILYFYTNQNPPALDDSQGLGLLTLAAKLTSDNLHHCQSIKDVSSCDPPWFLVTLFFFSIYLVALGQGGYKPCVQAFGGDQFDGQDPKESKAKSSFFNWWYFAISVGIIVTLIVMVYIQENLQLGPRVWNPLYRVGSFSACLLAWRRTYRYNVKENDKNPFMRIGRVIVRAIRNRHNTPSTIPSEEDACQWRKCSEQFKFLKKALLAQDGSQVDQNVCSVNDVEDTKALLKLVLIWITSLAYAIVFAQTTTFFTKQGATLDRKLSQALKFQLLHFKPL
ncbi:OLIGOPEPTIDE TRANSPORTER-RELATED [Salix purpurea]|uniref:OLIGOPEPTIDE TRANSPORTER-RELATED n=1 Tax=Salix purpurea TaxID=77065 RepID=A0A9Q0VBV4_SALPP|nr:OLIGOPEPTIDE TRANSPORTER-RELATED [Salix purpurea]